MVTLLAEQLERQRLDDVDSQKVSKLCGPSPSIQRGLYEIPACEIDSVFLGCDWDDPDCPARKRRRSNSIPGAVSPAKSSWSPKPSKLWSSVKRGKTTRSQHRRTCSTHSEESGVCIRESPVPRPASVSSFDWHVCTPEVPVPGVTKTALPTLQREVVFLRSNSQPCITDQTPTTPPQRPCSGGKKRQRERPSLDFFKMSESRSSENLSWTERSSPVLFINWPQIRSSPVFQDASRKKSGEALSSRESGYGSIEGSNISWTRWSDASWENELDISKIEEN